MIVFPLIFPLFLPLKRKSTKDMTKIFEWKNNPFQRTKSYISNFLMVGKTFLRNMYMYTRVSGIIVLSSQTKKNPMGHNIFPLYGSKVLQKHKKIFEKNISLP